MKAGEWFAIGALIGLVILIIYPGQYLLCRESAVQNEVEFRWSFLAGCSFKHPSGGWIPKSNYRVVGD